MSKLELTYHFETENELEYHVNSLKAQRVLDEIFAYLRTQYKHEEQEKWPNLEQIREHCIALANEEGYEF